MGISIIYAAMAISSECAVVAFEQPVKSFLVKVQPQLNQFTYFIIIAFFIVITLLNVYKLGYFTYGVINYEEGLKKLAKKEINTYSKDSCYEKMSKHNF